MELMGLPFPPEYGGAGLDMVSYCLFLEELGKACLATAATISVHASVASMCIYLSGTEEQKKKYLTPLAKGEKIGAFALTEPDAGSDAAAIATTAVRDGDSYLLNGSKAWIMNGDIAGTFVVFAKTDPDAGAKGITGFIVEKDTPGFKVGHRETKTGIRGVSTNQLFFTDCCVPAENMLGGVEGKGFAAAMKTLDCGRIGIAAICLGAAEDALARSVRFAKTREQFGGPVALKGAIQGYIADMATDVEAMRALVYSTAWMADQELARSRSPERSEGAAKGQPITKAASMAKLYASETAFRVINKAVQVHGGSGYVEDYPIERIYRDIRVTRIFEGTNEIQRFIIASHIFGEEGLKLTP
jgi:alkylation response protein AidB-like acyl-CoA dehydrogenase